MSDNHNDDKSKKTSPACGGSKGRSKPKAKDPVNTIVVSEGNKTFKVGVEAHEALRRNFERQFECRQITDAAVDAVNRIAQVGGLEEITQFAQALATALQNNNIPMQTTPVLRRDDLLDIVSAEGDVAVQMNQLSQMLDAANQSLRQHQRAIMTVQGGMDELYIKINKSELAVHAAKMKLKFDTETEQDVMDDTKYFGVFPSEHETEKSKRQRRHDDRDPPPAGGGGSGAGAAAGMLMAV
jgi:hypothetical protein